MVVLRAASRNLEAVELSPIFHQSFHRCAAVFGGSVSKTTQKGAFPIQFKHGFSRPLDPNCLLFFVRARAPEEFSRNGGDQELPWAPCGSLILVRLTFILICGI